MAESTSIRAECGMNNSLKLYCRIMLDAARRRPFQLAFLVLGGSLILELALDPLQHPSKLDLIFSNALLLGVALSWIVEIFCIDNRAVLWLPISKCARGRYNWAACTLIPLVFFTPLILAALYRFDSAGLASSILTAAAVFPLTVVFFFFPRLKTIRGRPDVFILPCFAMMLLAQYIHIALVERWDFPWLFVALAPFAVAAMYFSYRNANHLGAVHFVVQKERGPKEDRKTAEQRDTLCPEPWGTLCRNFLAITALAFGFLVPAMFVLFYNQEAGFFLLLTAAMLPDMSLVLTGVSLSRKLHILRSLPISRAVLAAVALTTAMAGALLHVIVYEVVRRVLQLHALPVFPVNLLLVFMGFMLFLPALLMLGGNRSALQAIVIVGPFMPVLIMHWAMKQPFWTPSMLPSMLIVFPVCLVAAFFLLRYALLNPHPVWLRKRE